ncbi:MAG: aldehyde dehydrogenase family protein [Candidatus Omnitrophota bacterium]|nr:aldehyde dehydrogenase family protein [Candidatus Omnitrophota bacterium]
MKKFTLLIDGKDLDTGDYRYFPNIDKIIIDPKKARRAIYSKKESSYKDKKHDHIYGKYCLSKDEDNIKAIDAAQEAFTKFKKISLLSKRKMFHDMYELLIKKKEEFIKILIAEGHPRKLAEWEFEGMRMGSSHETIDFYFSQIRKEIGRNGSEIVYWARKPDGVVCLNPPRNAASSNSYNAILALITGNTLIIKPPLKTPISTIFLWKEIIWEAIKKNGAPNGSVNIVLGNSQKILETWLSSPKVNDIIYFGNSSKGLGVGDKIFLARKKPILELSGNDLFLVWKDADIEGATNSLLDCFLGSTQICMVPKIAIIHETIYETFLDVFKRKIKSLTFGLPSDNDTIFSPVAKIKEFYEFLNDALEKGAKLLYGGERVNYLGLMDNNGSYIQPTLVEIEDSSNFENMKCFKDEIFFPLLPLVKITGNDDDIFEKIVNIVNNHEYGLRTSLWISSFKYLRMFAKNLDNTGLLRINTRHIGFSRYLSTHGGTKKSGGPFGEMNYFWQKTSHLQGVARMVR